MRAIDESLVDEVWREMTVYQAGRAEEEARAFLQRQPHVAAFCHAVTKGFDESVQKAALGLAFLLFKILEASLGTPFPSVARERVMEAYQATTEWLLHQEGADPRLFLRSVEGGGELSHRNLLQYLLTVFYVGDADNAVYDAEVKASLFLMLKTLSDALDMGLASQPEAPGWTLPPSGPARGGTL
ncbi:MAG: hypothetical protein HY724_08905 [Candidatus Rokubacteria bacterium]|nr:hypothetical protein [Candidatus Rokubacteria bacterium]